MAIYQANDKYRATLRSTWISSPADTTLGVTSVPDNVPTIVTVGFGTQYETVFAVTGKSGSTSNDYTLTGVTRLKGANTTIPENTAVNCLNNEEFFNQYSAFVNDEYLQMAEQASPPSTPDSGYNRLYAGTDGKWHIKNDGGVVGTLGELSDEWIDVSYASEVVLDLGSITNKLKFLTTATGTLGFKITNGSEGQVFMYRVVQDSTGSRVWGTTSANVETATMTIANPCVVTTSFDMKTGTPVLFTTTGALPTGVTASTVYYWIRTGATTGNLATSKANALAGTTVTSSGSQSGVHTLKPQILWGGGATPPLSTTKYAWDDFVFVYHAPGQVSGAVVTQDM